jgi:site-specific recombinase XerD
VEQAVEMFKTRKSDLAPTTLSKYQQTLGLLLYFCNREGRIHIHAVTESDVEKFKASLSDDAAYTRRNHQGRLRTFFRYCCASGQIRLAFNPTAPFESVDTSGEEIRFSNKPQECDLFFSTIPKAGLTEKKPREVRALAQVMLGAGLAIQDAVTLEREHIHKTTVNSAKCRPDPTDEQPAKH